MKRHWIIGTAVAVAIALLVGWIARNTYWDEVTVPRFLRGEAATNPFFAAQRFAEELGATTEWRRSMGEMPSTSSVMMLTQFNWDLIESRREDLQRWVESGGRLLLDDTLAGGEDALQEWSGLRSDFEVDAELTEEDDEAEAEEEFEPPEPCRELELTIGRAQSDATRDTYDVCGLSILGFITASRSPDWALEDETGMQAARVRIGRGSVTLINGTPFGTREMLEASNGVLFVDAVLLHHGDHIVFVSDDEHASILELIWIYGAPAVVLGLVFIAIAVWRNSMRFGPLEAPPDISRRSLAEQIRGTGQFVLRVGGGRALHAAMVRAVHEAARLRIPNYEALQADERIAALARIVGIETDKLAETINFNGARGHHELKHAVALLDSVRAKVLAHNVSGRRTSRAVDTADRSS